MREGKRKPPINSAVVIARLLDAEGFTEHTHNEIKRYWANSNSWPRTKIKKWERTKEALSEVAKRMPEGDKAILGRFIRYLCEINFQTGLRVGLAAFAAGFADKQVPPFEPEAGSEAKSRE